MKTRPMVAAPLEPPLRITSDKTKPQAEMVNLSVYTAGNKLQQIKKAGRGAGGRCPSR